jgi:hypothetical protein
MRERDSIHRPIGRGILKTPKKFNAETKAVSGGAPQRDESSLSCNAVGRPLFPAAVSPLSLAVILSDHAGALSPANGCGSPPFRADAHA